MCDETKHTMKEQVYLSLRNEILSGHYSDGEQLLQKDLAEKYEVSRIPVREALMQLASEGLVKLIPYKGAVVASLSLPLRAGIADHPLCREKHHRRVGSARS